MIKVTIHKTTTHNIQKRDWVKLYDSDHPLMSSQSSQKYYDHPDRRIEQYGNRDIEQTQTVEVKLFEQTIDEKLFDLTDVIKAVNGL